MHAGFKWCEPVRILQQVPEVGPAMQSPAVQPTSSIATSYIFMFQVPAIAMILCTEFLDSPDFFLMPQMHLISG